MMKVQKNKYKIEENSLMPRNYKWPIQLLKYAQEFSGNEEN